MTYVRNGEAKGAVHPNIGDDLAADGLAGYGTAGEKVSFGETGYMSSNGRYYKALADSDETMPVEVMFVSPANAGKEVVILKQGWVRNDAWNFIVKGNSLNKLYASGTTAGAITMRPPTDYRQVIGSIVDRNVIFFSPEPDINYGANTRQTIKDLETDINALYKYHTETITYPIFKSGQYEMFKKHPRLKILEAWIETKNNSEEDQIIELQDTELQDITAPLHISDTYKSGVAKQLTILKNLLGINEPVYITAQTDRYVTVNLLCESGEEN